jgi:U2-associated protein SR140
VPRKVARLHLICDILHNSAASVSNAWKFRQEFQSRLGLIFDHLSTIYHSFPGRITADSFKLQVTAIVDVWEGALVFPPEFTQNLRSRLEGVPIEYEEKEVIETKPDPQVATQTRVSKFKTTGFKPAVAGTEQASASDAIPSGSEVPGPSTIVTDEVDGEPMDDVDGEPMDNLDGEPMDDLDGEPMDDVDGDPM